MKKIVLFIFVCGVFWQSKAQIKNQNNKFIIFDEGAYINADYIGRLHYLLVIKSKNQNFESDGYKFIIPNRSGFNKYESLAEIGKKVILDTLNYNNVSDLSLIESCELHELLSIQEKIFLVKKYPINISYEIYPLKYKGTEKNIMMLQNGY